MRTCPETARDANGRTHSCSRVQRHFGSHQSNDRTVRGDWCGICWTHTDEAGYALVDFAR